MTNITFFLIFIPILSTILLLINFILAPHKPNKDKDAQFECGFSSFTQMSRLPFSISFFVYALLFLLFDLEILLVYPYVVSAYNNSIYGLIVMLVFFILLTIGFIFELGKKALQIDSRQTDVTLLNTFLSQPLTYYLLHVLPYRFMGVYRKYPNSINFTFYIFVSLSFQIFSSGVLYCDSSPDSVSDIKGKVIVVESSPSDSEDDIIPSTLDKGKGKAIEVDSGPSNTNVDVKGKGKAIEVESSPTNVEGKTQTISKIIRPEANTISTDGILPRPFTMAPDHQDYWENTYDDDDRRRHMTAIDRLGLEPDESEGMRTMTESVDDINRVMEEIRGREVDDEIVARKLAESLQEEDEAISRQIAESQELEYFKKRKLEESLQQDESIARKMQKTVYEADPAYSSDEESDYSVVSSMRGDESPKTFVRKLEILQLEANLKKK